MQAIQIFLVLALGTIVTALVAARIADRNGGFGPKMVVGVAIGLLAGLVVGALSGDLVPDAWETPFLVILVTAISVILVGAFAAERWAQR